MIQVSPRRVSPHKMPLEETVRAIRQADEDRRRRLAEEIRLRRPVVEIDHLITELEEIHLRGGIKVPQAMIPRIERFLESLPPGYAASFPLRTTITRVMDGLYEVQDGLLNRKDQRRARLRALDATFEPNPHTAA